MTKQNDNSKKDLKNIISEVKSLGDDLEEYKKGIQKIKDAPYEKQGDSETIGSQHEELVAELEEIANKLEELPKKWEKE